MGVRGLLWCELHFGRSVESSVFGVLIGQLKAEVGVVFIY
jgi:hypothetical protein